MTNPSPRRHLLRAAALCAALAALCALLQPPTRAASDDAPAETPAAAPSQKTPAEPRPAADAAPADQPAPKQPPGEAAPEQPAGEPGPEIPLYQQPPYDVITLDEHNDNRVLKVFPLDLPDRRKPDPLPIRGQITVRKIDEPESEYVILWNSVERIDLFHELVLAQADELVGSGEFERAYDYFEYLRDNDPQLPGLEESIDAYLYEEAKVSHAGGEYEDALAVLRQLHERNPEWPSLGNALGMVTDKLVERYVASNDYWTARQMLRNLNALRPDHEVVSKWEGRFRDEAAALLEQGRAAQKAGKLREAHAAGRRLMTVWPDLPGGREFIDSIQKQHPRVVVAVTMPAGRLEPGRIHDWASLRSSRLVCRPLMEFVGRGSEGGEYFCPFGTMAIRELGLQLAFAMDPERSRALGAGDLTGYDLARKLLTMADPRDPAYRPNWATLAKRVSVADVFGVEVALRRPHVRPEALLRSVVLDSVGASAESASSGRAVSLGPYLVESRSEEEVVYLANPAYTLGAEQPKEIVERYCRKGTQAVRWLERREIDVLDRVNPWDLDEMKAIDGVAVEPYSLPAVHCLIPNLSRPFTGRRAFRRALVYGIHREGILNHLLRGDRRPGCQVVSGPFSPGTSPDDPLDYGYDQTLEPRGYEPPLAIALAQVALSEVAEIMQKRGVDVAEIPEIVIAHPAHQIARVACASIQRQLELVQIPIVLRELPEGVPDRIPDDVDLLYAELTLSEPVVDAGRLLGEGGICGSSSSFMSQALRRLDQATDWAQVTDRLRAIHWLAHKETTVVPLWQLTDHFAYQESLEGLGAEPVSLYQNVERWEPSARYAAEEK